MFDPKYTIIFPNGNPELVNFWTIQNVVKIFIAIAFHSALSNVTLQPEPFPFFYLYMKFKWYKIKQERSL